MYNIFRLSSEEKGLTEGGIIYEMSCFIFLIISIFRYMQGSKLDAFNLFLQSIFSYLSDVVYLGKTSIWHIVDRYFAIYTCIVHFFTLKTASSFIANLIIIITAYNFLLVSQELYHKDDPDFSVFHTMWHLILFLMIYVSD